MKRLKTLRVLLIICMMGFGACNNSDNEALQKQMEDLQNQNEELSNRLEEIEQKTDEEVTEEPMPTGISTPVPTNEATAMPSPTEVPVVKPTEEPMPTATPSPTEAPVVKPTEEPMPTATPSPTITLKLTATPKPTATSKPTATPKPTVTLKPDPQEEAKIAKALKNIKVGKYITFGYYEQDNNKSNGKEPIEWLVLDICDGKALVLSRYVLDTKPFDKAESGVTWENSSIRKWLNGEFYDAAFSTAYKNRILLTNLQNPPTYGEETKYDDGVGFGVPFYTDCGNTTKDKVFLLNCDEAEMFFSEDVKVSETYYAVYGNEGRKTTLTEYAKNQNPGGWEVSWILRSLLNRGKELAYVNTEGVIRASNGYGHNRFDYNLGIRPALLIDLGEDYPRETKQSAKELNSKNAVVGEYVTFGNYEQDAKNYTDPEPIEWLVLAVEDKKALLLSRYALDYYDYAEQRKNAWEHSDVRGWLNSEFFNIAFTEKQKEKILVTEVVTQDNPKYGTYGGETTKDKIFVLSYEEVLKYFPTNKSRTTTRTSYADRLKEYRAGESSWLLRTPTIAGHMEVETSGDIDIEKKKEILVFRNGYIRPAMWVSLEQEGTLPQATATPVPTQKDEIKSIFQYKFSDEYQGMMIMDYIGSSTEVIIPETIEQSNVVAIYEDAFCELDFVEKVILPDTLKAIGDRAFNECINLTEINIPGGIERIGHYAFAGCENLKEIEVPDSVTEIGVGCFMECSNLKKVELSENITKLGLYFFEDCVNLESVMIPNKVTSFDSMVFKNCISLKSIEIPEGTTEILHNMFMGCESLEEIYIPDSVTVIEKGAFSGCDKLTIYTSSKTIANMASLKDYNVVLTE